MVKEVSFNNKANKLAGHLHLPENFSVDRKYPALVGIHPAGGVKEQVIGLYAKKLSAQGYVVLVYDASYQGESEGEPRLLEDPTTRVEDARCAADYLTTLPYVDEERMGVYGVCAGGGYAISVAQTERRFKAVATVSAASVGESSRNFLGYKLSIEDQIKNVEMARANLLNETPVLTIIDEAVLPLEKQKPAKKFWLLGGLVLGGILAVLKILLSSWWKSMNLNGE